MAQYEILIKQENGNGNNQNNLANGGGSGGDDQKQNGNLSGNSAQMKSAMRLVALQSAKSLVISKVGEVARDNLLQQQINFGVSAIETGMAFAINPAFGAISLAINVSSNLIDYQINLGRQQNRLGVMNERAGYINGSRDR